MHRGTKIRMTPGFPLKTTQTRGNGETPRLHRNPKRRSHFPVHSMRPASFQKDKKNILTTNQCIPCTQTQNN